MVGEEGWRGKDGNFPVKGSAEIPLLPFKVVARFPYFRSYNGSYYIFTAVKMYLDCHVYLTILQRQFEKVFMRAHSCNIPFYLTCMCEYTKGKGKGWRRRGR